jgi:hypothetical protein
MDGIDCLFSIDPYRVAFHNLITELSRIDHP